MNETKRVTEVINWDTTTPAAVKSALHALTHFSNISRDSDYVLAASLNDPPRGMDANVFLIQDQHKLQFMLELVDALNDVLANATVNAETTLSVSEVKYFGSKLFTVVGVVVAWSPDGTEDIDQGLPYSLDARLFNNGGQREIRVEVRLKRVQEADQTICTDDWRQGAILARAYYKARVMKKGIHELVLEVPPPFVRRVQLK